MWAVSVDFFFLCNSVGQYLTIISWAIGILSRKALPVPVDRVSTSSSTGMGPGWVTEEEDPKYKNKGLAIGWAWHRL